MRILVFGAGYSGAAFARLALGKAEFVGGTTRSKDKAAQLARMGLTPFLFDGRALSGELAQALSTITHLVVAAGPDEAGDPALNAAGKHIRHRMPELAWIGYLSTVGVYGDHDGAWVDEETSCRPVSKRSKTRLEVENDWRALGERRGVPVAVARLSGIYGPGRNAFVNLQTGTARRIVKPGQVFNRIHVADIAGALMFLAERRLGGVFNVSDDEPSPPQDVVAFAAELMGVEPPPEIAFDEAELTPMARSFYGEAKRVSNAKVRAAGYRFAFPDYRTALEAMWRDGSWR